MNNNGYEIEYKYLIKFPDTDFFSEKKGCRKAEILQTYLISEPGVTSRVRSWTENGRTVYYRTTKKRVSDQTAMEDEKEITKDEYESLLAGADPTSSPIRKTRYILPYCDHDLEIDVYPFWKKQAVLEIEVSEEGEAAAVPSYISIIRDVTGDKRYKNRSLAHDIPAED